jgi:ribonuclease P protein component
MKNPLSENPSRRLRKYEILRKQKDIEQLFGEAMSVRQGSLKVLYVVQAGQSVKGLPVALFSVSKRLVSKANLRNRIKRQLREVYRHQKAILNMPETTNVKLAFLYQSRRDLKSDTDLHERLERDMIAVLEKLNALIHKPNPETP